jgi:GNAT superfamily N-acetyltransferase
MTDTAGMELRLYRPEDWENVHAFIKANWRDDHPFGKKALFDWQFGGFGNEEGKVGSVLLFHEGALIGFRGVIPGLYQVPDGDGGMTILPGGSLALWMIREDYRGKGLASVMHREAQSRMQVITGAGSHPKTSVPVYLKFGFTLLDTMNRFVAPLEAEGYSQLLPGEVPPGEIEEWSESVRKFPGGVEPTAPDVERLGAHWKETTFPLRIFSIFRNAGFWKWRYVESAGFRYLFFGDVQRAGVVVGRVEKIHGAEDRALNGRTVLRIIEIIPADGRAWQGEEDPDLALLLQGVLRWGTDHGCLAADFHCSNGRFFPTLKRAGFRRQDFKGGSPECNLAHLFQPFRFVTRPINALYHIEIPGRGLVKPDFEDTHMVKSENDMDRPNIHDFEGLL